MILITGGTGQLGCALIEVLTSKNIKFVAPTHSELDVSDYSAVKKYIRTYQPTSVVHTAAWTNVRTADDPTNKEEVFKQNVDSTRFIAKICNKENIPMMYISTNYVFGGVQAKPYTESQRCCPCCYYGETKREGEKFVEKIQKHFIVRTGWLYGTNASGEWWHNMVGGIIRRANQNSINGLSGLSFRKGTPTWAKDLAYVLSDILETDKFGTYHITNEGETNGYELTRAIVDMLGKNSNDVENIEISKSPFDAPRPNNGVLDTSSLSVRGFIPLPDWKTSIKNFIQETSEKTLDTEP